MIMSLPVVALLTVILIILVIYMIYGLPRDRIGYIRLPKRVMPKLMKALAIKEGQTLIDLGCGNGQILQAALKAHSAIHVIGIEVNPVVMALARLRLLPYRNRVQLVRADLLHQDLHQSQRIFTYLNDVTMAALEVKFVAELPAGARLVSCDFPLPTRKPNQTIVVGHRRQLGQTLYIYDF